MSPVIKSLLIQWLGDCAAGLQLELIFLQRNVVLQRLELEESLAVPVKSSIPIGRAVQMFWMSAMSYRRRRTSLFPEKFSSAATTFSH
jgi:hypothetical protein